MNFPNTHYLCRPANVIAEADVVIGMELSDYWDTVNGFVDNGDDGFGKNLHKVKPGTKLISISSVDLITKSNYQDFQRFQSIDISMPGDAEATLPSLIEAVKSAISNDRKDAMSKRGDAIRQAHAKGLDATKQAAAIAWDANPDQHRAACSPRSMRRSRTSIGRWCRPPAIPATGPTGFGRWRSIISGSVLPAATASATAHPRPSARRSATAIWAGFRCLSSPTAT